MNKEIKEIVNKIYIEKKYQFYIDKCKKELNEIYEIFDTINEPDIELVEDYSNSDCYPSSIFTINLPQFTKGNFISLFSTKVMVCKIIPLFYVQHEFEIENQTDDKMAPSLDGFGNQAYTKRQFHLHKKVQEVLLKKQYVELDYLSINEIICNVSFSDDITLFGNQVSVEFALFHDILDICDDD